jgi:predicted lipoprotein with Yx(FWY)xxD motif
MFNRVPARPVGLMAVVVLVAAACSSTGSTAPSSAPATQAAASSAAASPSAGETLEVTVATDAKLGMYLAGKDGKTLYLFKNDTANTSNCSGQCATNWPPLTLGQGAQVKGAAGVTGTFSTFARGDGAMQVAYNTLPLYYYAADQTAGDVKGEGVANLWTVAKP